MIVSTWVGFSVVVVVGAAAAVARMEVMVMVMAFKKCILKSKSSQVGKNVL